MVGHHMLQHFAKRLLLHRLTPKFGFIKSPLLFISTAIEELPPRIYYFELAFAFTVDFTAATSQSRASSTPRDEER